MKSLGTRVRLLDSCVLISCVLDSWRAPPMAVSVAILYAGRGFGRAGQH
jgi:hypothetical protein